MNIDKKDLFCWRFSGGVFLAGATISGSGISGFTGLAGSIDVKLSL